METKKTHTEQTRHETKCAMCNLNPATFFGYCQECDHDLGISLEQADYTDWYDLQSDPNDQQEEEVIDND